MAATATRFHLFSLPAIWLSPAAAATADDGDLLFREVPIVLELSVTIGVNANACSSAAFSINQSDLPPFRLPLATTKSSFGPCHGMVWTGPDATTCAGQHVTIPLYTTSCHISNKRLRVHARLLVTWAGAVASGCQFEPTTCDCTCITDRASALQSLLDTRMYHCMGIFALFFGTQYAPGQRLASCLLPFQQQPV